MPFKFEFWTNDHEDERTDAEQFEAAMAAIGFMRRPSSSPFIGGSVQVNDLGKITNAIAAAVRTATENLHVPEGAPVEGVAEPENDAKPEIDLDKFTVQGKPRTRPYQTRVRRTKAELEALNTPEGKAAADKVMREELARIQGLPTDPTFIAEMEIGIQSGEERTDPAVEAEAAEEVAEAVQHVEIVADDRPAEIKDAMATVGTIASAPAKEIETPATVPAGKPVTHDTVRAAMGEYQKKFGFPAAREDVPKILTPYARTPEIPDEQPALLKAIKAFEDAIATNPYKRDVVK